MCVIAVVDEKRPTEEMVERMYAANPNGAGVAWREEEHVRWEKGLDVKGAVELCATVPLPYIAHFRIPSCGGDLPELTHPFTINKSASTALAGKTKDHVLFHNGHWTDWKRMCLETAMRFAAKLPAGKWSDSRAMAWLAHFYGVEFLDMIEEKIVAFGPRPEDLHVFQGRGQSWVKVDDIYVSNSSFNYRYRETKAKVFCREGTCRNYATDSSVYCEEHRVKVYNASTGSTGGDSATAGFRRSGQQGTQIEGEIVPNGRSVRALLPLATNADSRSDTLSSARRWACSINLNKYKTPRP